MPPIDHNRLSLVFLPFYRILAVLIFTVLNPLLTSLYLFHAGQVSLPPLSSISCSSPSIDSIHRVARYSVASM